MFFRTHIRHPMINLGFIFCVLMLLPFSLNACSENAAMKQQASDSKVNLDNELNQAKNIGVPASQLNTILQQEEQLTQAHPPFTMFSAQPATNYYANLAERYQMLTVQTRSLETQSTQQLDYRATLDLQDFATILAQRQAQGFMEANPFVERLTQDQNLMSQAQYPGQYSQISADATDATQSLRLMGPASASLTSLQKVIQQLETSHLDVTALNTQFQYDTQLYQQASTPAEFTSVIDQVNAQLQQTTTLSTHAMPYVGVTRLQEFSNNISLMKQYGQNVTDYEKQLQADTTALNKARTIGDYLQLSSRIDNDVSSIQLPLIQGQASYLLKQFHNEVADWGNTHQYHNPYNGFDYNLDYEYDLQGIGANADLAVQNAQTQDDYLAAIDLINHDMLHLKAMQADYHDQTPWNQPHAADMQLIQNYNLTATQVIVVSLYGQTLRVYDNSQLVKAFKVTTGQYERPSLPGYWHIFLRQSPTKFKSSEPQGSAFWYPDTNINFAMAYHDGGYYFHDSWWRANYGYGTNFPHIDSSGNQSFAGNGSHGCINMPESAASWLYTNTSYGTAVLIY
jgi:L,D-transpeptidase catalytic domain